MTKIKVSISFAKLLTQILRSQANLAIWQSYSNTYILYVLYYFCIFSMWHLNNKPLSKISTEFNTKISATLIGSDVKPYSILREDECNTSNFGSHDISQCWIKMLLIWSVFLVFYSQYSPLLSDKPVFDSMNLIFDHQRRCVCTAFKLY